MKRNAFALFLSVLLLFSLAVSVSASTGLPMVVDNADLLTREEESALETKAQELRSKYEMDIVILTVNSLEGESARNYADDYFDYQGYGYGENASGILFLLAMNEREWYISTCGNAIYAFTDRDIQQLGEDSLWFIDYGYSEVFDAYLTYLPDYLDYYSGNVSPSIFLSLVIGVIVATVVVLIMRSSMNTKRQQHGAVGYMKAGSFHLKTHQDLFLYSRVSKIRRQQNNPGGGGTRVHQSSSGRSHGGGGGKF